MQRLWGGDATRQGIYRVNKKDNDRVGNCWIEGRLKDDDLILCVEKAGDWFYTYYLIHYINYTNKKWLEMELIPKEFGAYQIGTFLHKLKSQEFHLLMAREKIKVEIDCDLNTYEDN